MANEQLDHPFEEVLARAEQLVAEGATIFQKFTCANCGARQTMEEKNTFFAEGSCEECGYITNIRAQGCNYLVVMDLHGGDK